MPDISVIIPCYNEEANAEPIARAVIAQIEPMGLSFEILFIDNASQDRTVQIIKNMCSTDPRIRLIVNNRNYGQMRSPTHGIYQCSGRAIIGIVADFQDPPELIPEFIRRWQAGADIVLGQRAAEEGSRLFGAVRNLAYSVLGRFSDYHILPNVTGFGLYDRKVVDHLRQWHEPEPLFRGMLVESGYNIELIPHDRRARAAGKSSNDLVRLIDFSLSALSASSRKMLRLPFFVGAFLMMGAFASLAGWGTAMALGAQYAATLGWLGFFSLNFGFLFLFLGLAGDQIRLIAERTRNAPLVIERERVNFPSEEA